MREEFADLWDVEADVRCITTNGTVIWDGQNIMGGGCALEAADRYPGLPYTYGRLIRSHGHHVFLIGDLVMFPVKRELREPADLELIHRSFNELEDLADIYGWERIAVPRPGCGLGGLSWEKQVKPAIESYLDDRFTIVHFVTVPETKESHEGGA